MNNEQMTKAIGAITLILSVLMEREEGRGEFSSKHNELITLAGLTMAEVQKELRND